MMACLSDISLIDQMIPSYSLQTFLGGFQRQESMSAWINMIKYNLERRMSPCISHRNVHSCVTQIPTYEGS